MTRDPRYDVLFESVQIGPLKTRNRFYQVPHGNAMGHRQPFSVAAMRGMKAEGGWGVVCTEETEIHHSSEIAPAPLGRIWDEKDIPALRLMTDAVHEQGSLAGIELVYNGVHSANRYSREVPLGPSDVACDSLDPVQVKRMDKKDIAEVRRWHRDAAKRARDAGFDIIYVYSGHSMSLPMHFISRQFNNRDDEYGGSLENRVRLFRELIEDARDAIGDTCALAVRCAVDELIGPSGITHDSEGKDIIEMLAELPDLWDINLSDWSNDSVSARFSSEGYQEQYVKFVKSVTTKPVVGVGRFTSPDTMVSQINRGVLDLIGAARASIADPFLPNKIEAGNVDDIRECIGCNICVAFDNVNGPIRCTQNPTMGEEWRKGWHPEKVPPAPAAERVLIVGGGPAGMECARILGMRGFQVTLAESTTELGGRVLRESRLPGLSTWLRVRDYRTQQLSQMANVDIYFDSEMTVEQIVELESDHVVIATGSAWKRNANGRSMRFPVDGLTPERALTADDILADGFSFDRLNEGPIVIYDDDHYVTAGALAELALNGTDMPVHLVTPEARVSAWTENTLEQRRIQKRLMETGAILHTNKRVVAIDDHELIVECVYTGDRSRIPCTTFIPVTEREPDRRLYEALESARDKGEAGPMKSLHLIGDALAPGLIAAAIYGGHRTGRELELDVDRAKVPFRREVPWHGSQAMPDLILHDD